MGSSLLDDDFCSSLLMRANLGEFLAIFAVPPRATISSGDIADGRTRIQPDALPPTPTNPTRASTDIVISRTMEIIHFAARAGSQYAICGLADYEDCDDPRLFIDSSYVPLWLLAPVVDLAASTGGRTATLAMCSHGSARLDYTSPPLSTRPA